MKKRQRSIATAGMFATLYSSMPIDLAWIPSVLAECLPVDWTVQYSSDRHGGTHLLVLRSPSGAGSPGVVTPILLAGEYYDGILLFADLNLFPDKEERLRRMVRSIVEPS